MHAPDDDFDPDDNFAHGFAHSRDQGADLDDEAGTEALVWQLLLLVNPGDEDSALQQMAAFQEAWDPELAGGAELAAQVQRVIDWKAGFHVDEDDAATFVDCIDELAARWNLRLDWGDAYADEGFAGADLGALASTAFDRLREYGYTLWSWDTGEHDVAGWISLSREDEAMQQIASELAIPLRPGVG